MKRLLLLVLSTALLFLLPGLAAAAGAADAEPRPKLAVLEFELHDLTLTPNRPEELARTASVAGLLRQALQHMDALALVEIPPGEQQRSDLAHGYIFDRPQIAAALGVEAGADWVAVGRVHKPTDLFAYLIVNLVRVDDASVAGEFKVEVKGAVPKVTRRGAARLAEKIAAAIAAEP